MIILVRRPEAKLAKKRTKLLFNSFITESRRCAVRRIMHPSASTVPNRTGTACGSVNAEGLPSEILKRMKERGEHYEG